MTLAIAERPARSTTPDAPVQPTRFLSLDITRKCQANCTHCYNGSSPTGSAGTMTRDNWISVLDQAAAMGVEIVQFIGGDPTTHPDLTDLIAHTLDAGMRVEVFSNLVAVSRAQWRAFRQRGVTLATSYYSDRAEEHEAITRRPRSYRHTRANIEKALRFGIPLRAAIIDVLDNQRIEEAKAELRRLGVTKIRVDRLRAIGRGADDPSIPDMAELCGNCGRGRAAIMPDGKVTLCQMSGAMNGAGNVLTGSLASIIGNHAWMGLMARVPSQRGGSEDVDPCTPAEEPSETEDASTAKAECGPGDTDGCGPDDKDDH